MSHKIHPKNYRLGYLLEWENKWFNCSWNYSNLLSKNLKIYEYLDRILFKHFLFLGDFSLKDNNNKLSISLICYPFIGTDKRISNSNYSQSNISWYLIRNVLQSYFGKSIQINYYYCYSLLNHPNFITGWLCLFLEKEVDLKTILNHIKKIIEYEQKKISTRSEKDCTNYSLRNCSRNQTNFGDYYYCNRITWYDRFFGTKIVFLKGLKILISGRLQGLQNQMATTETMEVGTVPLQTKEYIIIYSFKDFVTKHGTYGIKVWLFYK
nr:ribosomal protein S3 [Cyanidioschyzonaceae sp. 1 FvB-2021]